MLTTLSIISLDQGRLWKAEPTLTEEEVAQRQAACQRQNGGTWPPFWTSLVRRLRPGPEEQRA